MKHIYVTILCLIHLNLSGQKAELYIPLCESIDFTPICINQANEIVAIFDTSAAFDWKDRKNNCEDRANAICLILDKWKVSNGKAWIFGGKKASYKDGEGTLKGWSYHVAPCVFVQRGNDIDTVVIDLLTSKVGLTVQEWADTITYNPTNIFFITGNDKYQQNSVSLNPTWKMSQDFFDETIKGLTGYNDYSVWQRMKTKKLLKRRIKGVKRAFYNLYDGELDRIRLVDCN